MTRSEIVRREIRYRGLRHWEVAKAIGIHETTFCRWLREEVDEDRFRIIMLAIQEVGENAG